MASPHPYSPEENMLYLGTILGFQHTLSIPGFHVDSMGVHCTQLNSALSPMAMFIVTMMNQMSHLILPSVSRRSVRAKLVLDQMAAVSVVEPAALMRTIMATPSAGSLDQSYQ